MLDRCPKCGGLFALIGYRHLCREKPTGQPATPPATVTEGVTRPAIKSVTPSVTLCERCLLLEAEVKRLKRELAEGGMKRVGLSAAERMRRMRARRRNSSDRAAPQ